ncbi:putative sulfate transporter YPR003C [Trichomonascus vanleenenianus]|uniref:uncharacterized protein n=1 Tax=Trichomonascus vanleenenianus TaxID=2268995 RepID=UPI003ECA1AAC
MSASERTKLLARPPYLRQSSNIVSRPDTPQSIAAEDIEIPESGYARPHGHSYWAYYIPAMSWIPHYRLEYLFGDVCAGLTLASFQIPISMSYASSLAKTPTVTGLYGLVIPPLMYSVLGSVPQMIVGPEAPISLVVGQAMGPYLHEDSEWTLSPSQVVGLISGISGAVLFLAGICRIGFLDSVLSRSLLRGFISAVGFVVVIDQFPAELGLEKLMHKVAGPHPTTVAKMRFLWNYTGETHALTARIAFSAVAFIIAMRIIKHRYSKTVKWVIFVPEILLAVIATTVVCDVWNLNESGVEVVGRIRPERVHVELPFTPAKWLDFKANFSAAFFAAILGFFESTVAAKTLGSRFDLNVSTNRELVALGACNLVGSLFSALTSFGGYGRSKINALSGAKTQLSSVILAVVTVLCIQFAMPYFYYLPKCMLSAVITVVGISLLEEAPADISFYWKISGYEDLFTIALTFFVTVFWSVQTGIAAGVGFSVVRVLHQATKPNIQILGRVPGTTVFRDADELPEDLEAVPGSLIVKIAQPLNFVNTSDLRNRLRRLEMYGSLRIHPAFPRLLNEEMSRHVIFDLRGMTACDSSAIQILDEIIQGYIKRGIVVLFARMPYEKTVRVVFETSGINKLVLNQPNNNYGNAFFDSIQDALNSIDSRS